jgi:hypothetical protein
MEFIVRRRTSVAWFHVRNRMWLGVGVGTLRCVVQEPVEDISWLVGREIVAGEGYGILEEVEKRTNQRDIRQSVK